MARSGAKFCPGCGASLLPDALPHDYHKPAAGIELDQINEADCILIRTRNSEYQFSLIDPVGRRGVLSGGEFGDDPHDATLVGALCRGDAAGSDTSCLRTDARALFYLRAEAGIKRFTTSPVTRLVHVRNGNSRVVFE